MATIDVDELRRYLIDYCESAIFGGFPAAIVDVASIEFMDAIHCASLQNGSAWT